MDTISISTIASFLLGSVLTIAIGIAANILTPNVKTHLDFVTRSIKYRTDTQKLNAVKQELFNLRELSQNGTDRIGQQITDIIRMLRLILFALLIIFEVLLRSIIDEVDADSLARLFFIWSGRALLLVWCGLILIEFFKFYGKTEWQTVPSTQATLRQRIEILEMEEKNLTKKLYPDNQEEAKGH